MLGKSLVVGYRCFGQPFGCAMENLFCDTDANLETVHGKHLNNERLKLGGLFLHCEMTSIVDFRSLLCLS